MANAISVGKVHITKHDNVYLKGDSIKIKIFFINITLKGTLGADTDSICTQADIIHRVHKKSLKFVFWQ